MDRAAALAAAMLAFRRYRSETLPAELFGEPGWELLLELFVADAQGRRITGKEVSERSSISPTVLSRWLKHLDSLGFTVGDGSGNLDDELTLSAKALEYMETTMTRAAELHFTLLQA